MRQKFRTTCHADVIVHYEKSLAEHPQAKQETVGFRLAFSSATRPVRGATANDTKFTAGHVSRAGYNPRSNAAFLGFRLVRDE